MTHTQRYGISSSYNIYIYICESRYTHRRYGGSSICFSSQELSVSDSTCHSARELGESLAGKIQRQIMGWTDRSDRFTVTQTIFYWVIYGKYMGSMVIYGCLPSGNVTWLLKMTHRSRWFTFSKWWCSNGNVAGNQVFCCHTEGVSEKSEGTFDTPHLPTPHFDWGSHHRSIEVGKKMDFHHPKRKKIRVNGGFVLNSSVLCFRIRPFEYVVFRRTDLPQAEPRRGRHHPELSSERAAALHRAIRGQPAVEGAWKGLSWGWAGWKWLCARGKATHSSIIMCCNLYISIFLEGKHIFIYICIYIFLFTMNYKWI